MTVARDLTIGGEEAQGDEQNQGQKKRGSWRAGILLSYEDDGRILTFDFGYVFVVVFKLTNQNAILSCTQMRSQLKFGERFLMVEAPWSTYQSLFRLENYLFYFW